jgi:hypothetical protein
MSAQLTATKADRHDGPERGNVRAELVPSAHTLDPHKLDRIARVHGEGLRVVSVYLAVHPGPDGRRALRTKTGSRLRRVRSRADDGSLDHDARMSLRADIERIDKIARTEMPVRGTLAVFACSGPECSSSSAFRARFATGSWSMRLRGPGRCSPFSTSTGGAVRWWWWWTGSRPTSGSCTSARCETRDVSRIARRGVLRTPAGMGSPRCCDSSPGKHARRHAHVGQPIVQAYLPPDDWRWCYVDETYV